jgi:hypothetical protein
METRSAHFFCKTSKSTAHATTTKTEKPAHIHQLPIVSMMTLRNVLSAARMAAYVSKVLPQSLGGLARLTGVVFCITARIDGLWREGYSPSWGRRLS